MGREKFSIKFEGSGEEANLIFEKEGIEVVLIIIILIYQVQ